MKVKSLFIGFLCLILSLSLVSLDSVYALELVDEEAYVKDVSIEWKLVPYFEYESEIGDYFLVDVSNAVGYLMNDNTRYFTAFPVMTGAKRTPTPYKDWIVLQKDIKSNKIVYSKSGEFFRMFINDGTTRTGYGIHGYAFFDKEISEGRKFLSLGCIMVSDPILDLIEKSFIANGNTLKVSTKKSVNLLI